MAHDVIIPQLGYVAVSNKTIVTRPYIMLANETMPKWYNTCI
jgi:hypothetical protein